MTTYEKEIKPKIIIAASAGGHLTEALLICQRQLERYPERIVFFSDYFPRTEALPFKKFLFPVFEYNPLDYLNNLFKIFLVYKRFKPDVIITTGAQIGMLAVWMGWACNIKTIFIETITRKDNATLSAKAVKPFVDVLLVQNQTLLKQLSPKAIYKGGII